MFRLLLILLVLHLATTHASISAHTMCSGRAAWRNFMA
ncbi:hypothetical protein DHEL01_v203544 [Diaporthe helianthi]|uniref:Uncharacterized protein n=1 Tax=Diaporthe helianthi TaxID=158607 RepID=A0A2P5I6B6_DIAHE|nr:hypothetical protein DHEL01_v203544 [Diaporthe helianthi]